MGTLDGGGICVGASTGPVESAGEKPSDQPASPPVGAGVVCTNGVCPVDAVGA